MSDVIGHMLIDDDIDAYTDIFTSEFGNEIGNRPTAGTKVRSITDNLLINWRSAGYVAGMPPQYVLGIEKSVRTISNTPTGGTELLNLADGMLKRITAKVPDLFADPALRRSVHEALVDLGAAYQEKLANTPFKLDVAAYWQQYLHLAPFQQYVWSSERLSYQSVYNAYEEFIVECARVANNLPKLRSSGNDENKRDFRWYFREAFGDSMIQECWHYPEVNRIRLIRHSLAHAGGKITDNIKTAGISVREYKGVIHMFPGDVREAIHTLGNCVLKIIDVANTKPEFN
jgi:hypothetical protein